MEFSQRYLRHFVRHRNSELLGCRARQSPCGEFWGSRDADTQPLKCLYFVRSRTEIQLNRNIPLEKTKFKWAQWPNASVWSSGTFEVKSRDNVIGRQDANKSLISVQWSAHSLYQVSICHLSCKFTGNVLCVLKSTSLIRHSGFCTGVSSTEITRLLFGDKGKGIYSQTSWKTDSSSVCFHFWKNATFSKFSPRMGIKFASSEKMFRMNRFFSGREYCQWN